MKEEENVPESGGWKRMTGRVCLAPLPQRGHLLFRFSESLLICRTLTFRCFNPHLLHSVVSIGGSLFPSNCEFSEWQLKPLPVYPPGRVNLLDLWSAAYPKCYSCNSGSLQGNPTHRSFLGEVRVSCRTALLELMGIRFLAQGHLRLADVYWYSTGVLTPVFLLKDCISIPETGPLPSRSQT